LRSLTSQAHFTVCFTAPSAAPRLEMPIPRTTTKWLCGGPIRTNQMRAVSEVFLDLHKDSLRSVRRSPRANNDVTGTYVRGLYPDASRSTRLRPRLWEEFLRAWTGAYPHHSKRVTTRNEKIFVALLCFFGRRVHYGGACARTNVRQPVRKSLLSTRPPRSSYRVHQAQRFARVPTWHPVQRNQRPTPRCWVLRAFAAAVALSSKSTRKRPVPARSVRGTTPFNPMPATSAATAMRPVSR